MNKEAFQTIVANYTSLNLEEADSLAGLLSEYPFSQLIHNLATRAAQDFSLPHHNEFLHSSAIYSTDRTVLRQVMMAPRKPRLVIPSDRTLELNSAPPIVSFETPIIVDLTSKQSGEAFYSEVEEDLKKLAESKLRFEQVVEGLEKIAAKPLVAVTPTEIAIDPPVRNEVLIEEIKNSKENVTIDGDKQKEQIEIIDEFIKTQPSISPAKSVSPKVEDLSEKYDMYGDNIMSEPLVEILIKQGKKEKAIEMLKKLIWKFPQKKAYFAAQIEALKK